MPDLSTLDETKPENTELARLGAGRIRDVALAVETSFGVEHSLVGYHKFLTGNTAARPAPGNAGRLFINTARAMVEKDNGLQWSSLHAGVPVVNAVPGTISLTGAFQNLASVVIDVPLNTFLLIIAGAEFNLGTSSAIEIKLEVDAAPPNLGSQGNIAFGTGVALVMPGFMSGLSGGVAEGNHTVTFQARSSAGNVIVQHRILTVIGL